MNHALHFFAEGKNTHFVPRILSTLVFGFLLSLIDKHHGNKRCVTIVFCLAFLHFLFIYKSNFVIVCVLFYGGNCLKHHSQWQKLLRSYLRITCFLMKLFLFRATFENLLLLLSENRFNHFSSPQCVPVPEYGEARGGYRCLCKRGFYHHAANITWKGFSGDEIENGPIASQR